jgi:hypothetical protein
VILIITTLSFLITAHGDEPLIDETHELHDKETSDKMALGNMLAFSSSVLAAIYFMSLNIEAKKYYVMHRLYVLSLVATPILLLCVYLYGNKGADGLDYTLIGMIFNLK